MLFPNKYYFADRFKKNVKNMLNRKPSVKIIVYHLKHYKNTHFHDFLIIVLENEHKRIILTWNPIKVVTLTKAKKVITNIFITFLNCVNENQLMIPINLNKAWKTRFSKDERERGLALLRNANNK